MPVRRSVQSASGATSEANSASAIVISPTYSPYEGRISFRIWAAGRKAVIPTKTTAGRKAISTAMAGSTLWRKLRWRPSTRCRVCFHTVASAHTGALRGPS